MGSVKAGEAKSLRAAGADEFLPLLMYLKQIGGEVGRAGEEGGEGRRGEGSVKAGEAKSLRAAGADEFLPLLMFQNK